MRCLRLTSLFALALVLCVVGPTSALPAHAHAALVESTPADGATVETLPPAISLTFNEDLIAAPGTTTIEVLDDRGETLATGDPTVTGPTASQSLASTSTTGGEVSVRWRVVSADGHPVTGELAFVVVGTPQPTPTPTAASASAAPEASPSPTAVPIASGAVPGWVAPAVVGVVVVAGVGIGTFVMRRRRAA